METGLSHEAFIYNIYTDMREELLKYLIEFV